MGAHRDEVHLLALGRFEDLGRLRAVGHQAPHPDAARLEPAPVGLEQGLDLVRRAQVDLGRVRRQGELPLHAEQQDLGAVEPGQGLDGREDAERDLGAVERDQDPADPRLVGGLERPRVGQEHGRGRGPHTQAEQDLVVLTTHGSTGLDRLLRGSVAEALLRECETPLLLCNPRALEHVQEHRFENILVPVDGSERSRRILPIVERVAAAHDARVKLFQVEPMIIMEVPSPVAVGSLWDPAPLEAGLAPAVDRLESAGLRAEAQVSSGVVAAEILGAAQEADLLAMTTHGRSGVSRWWFGSVAEQVLRQATCPLLLLRAAE